MFVWLCTTVTTMTHTYSDQFMSHRFRYTLRARTHHRRPVVVCSDWTVARWLVTDEEKNNNINMTDTALASLYWLFHFVVLWLTSDGRAHQLTCVVTLMSTSEPKPWGVSGLWTTVALLLWFLTLYVYGMNVCMCVCVVAWACVPVYTHIEVLLWFEVDLTTCQCCRCIEPLFVCNVEIEV